MTHHDALRMVRLTAVADALLGDAPDPDSPDLAVTLDAYSSVDPEFAKALAILGEAGTETYARTLRNIHNDAAAGMPS